MFRFGDPGGRAYAAVGAAGANILAWWSSYDPRSSTISVSAGNGRTGGSCLRFNIVNNSNPAQVSKTLSAQPTWGVAFAFRSSGGLGAMTILALEDGINGVQIDLRVQADGSLVVTRNGTTLGTTAAAAVAQNAYAHLELKATIDPSAGAAQLWVNGVSALNLSGVNTRATANASASIVRLGGIAVPGFGGGNLDFDDVIVYDGQATDPNGNADITGPVGDCGLAWLLPTGAGATTQFTPDSGANYARVNEATPDGDTSYVESGTVGNIDTYAMADLPAGATAVKSVASVHYARKTDVGSRGMKAELRSGGGNTAHAAEIALGNSYQYYFSNWGRDPNNGTPAAWTVAAVNALEAGQTVSS